jgi:YesN/AraC family two-component response regulator
VSARASALFRTEDATRVAELASELLGIGAEGGSEALRAAKAGSIDVVITDLAMPEMSGLDLAKRIKAMDRDQIRAFLAAS